MSASADRPDRRATDHRVPGEPGIWILVFGDLVLFGIFFATFASAKRGAAALFARSQETLNQGLGLANTLLLLTSSWAVAKCLGEVRAGNSRAASRYASLAITLGIGFVIVKIFEYREKIVAGLYPTTNDFFMFYFAYTGIHLFHVLAGLAALAFLRSFSARPNSAATLSVIEGCGIFWHLVDILWVVLFAILYLHR